MSQPAPDLVSILIRVAVYGFLLFAYCWPGILAFQRHHHWRNAIMMLTLLLGWTVIGWIGAVV